MKKHVSILMAMLLLVTAILSGCGGKGGDKKIDIAGDWKATVDCTSLMADELAELEEMTGPLTGLEFNLDLDVSFKEDGTYSMNMNEDSVKAAIDNLFDNHLKDGMMNIFEQQIAENNLDMSVEDLLALSGLDLDALLEEGKKEALSSMDGINPLLEGSYAVKDGKLYLSSDADSDPLEMPEEDACDIKMENGTLTLSAPASVSEDEAFLFPMELKK